MMYTVYGLPIDAIDFKSDSEAVAIEKALEYSRIWGNAYLVISEYSEVIDAIEDAYIGIAYDGKFFKYRIEE